jgi:hypothetical protein
LTRPPQTKAARYTQRGFDEGRIAGWGAAAAALRHDQQFDPVNWFQKTSGDEKGREFIATCIIDLARSGLIDSAALRDRVITEARLSE